MNNLLDQYTQLIAGITKSEMTMLPSEFAEKYISISSAVSKSAPGKMEYKWTPYAREIVDTLSPYHPAKVVGILKGAQLGISQMILVPGIAWSIAQDPSTIASFSANDELSQQMVSSRIDEAIASAGLQHLIKPNTIKKRNARTGDTSKGKEFAGGELFVGGLKSIDKLSRQRSFHKGFFDDWSSSDVAFKKQGNLFKILQQRFSTAANTMKQYYISTPESDPDPMENVYLMGDQRKWMLPCPCCGERIELIWKQIKWDLKDGRLDEKSVRYKCQECGEGFSEKHKHDMNQEGVWTPTAIPVRPGYYSYHLSALVAAPFMYGWTHYVYEWLDTFNRSNQMISKLKVFKNQVLGEVWREKKQFIKKNVLAGNTREYTLRTVPNEMSIKDGNGSIVLLTCACDLNGTLEDGRLDYEVKAWSENGSSYSVDAGSVGTYQPGKTNLNRDLWTYRNSSGFNNIWDSFYEEVVNEEYRLDSGVEMKILLTGVDVGYLDKYAWRFIDSHKDQVTGVKGASHTLLTKEGKDIKYFASGKEKPNLWILQGDKLKDDLAENINLVWNKKKGETQPDGFMNFPLPEQGKYTVPGYYKQYENETKDIETDDDGNNIGYKWVRKNNVAANHFFDCAFYNIAIRRIIVHKMGQALKNKEFTWIDFVDYIKARYV